MIDVKIVLTENGAAVGTVTPDNEDIFAARSACEALGQWAYHNRHKLGLRFDLRAGGRQAFSK